MNGGTAGKEERMAKKKGPRCEECGSRKTRVVSKEKLEEISEQGRSHPLMMKMNLENPGYFPGGDHWSILEAVAEAIESVFDWLTERDKRWVFCKKCGHLSRL